MLPELIVSVFFIDLSLVLDHLSSLGKFESRECFFHGNDMWVQSADHDSLRVATQAIFEQVRQLRLTKIDVGGLGVLRPFIFVLV